MHTATRILIAAFAAFLAAAIIWIAPVISQAQTAGDDAGGREDAVIAQAVDEILERVNRLEEEAGALFDKLLGRADRLETDINELSDRVDRLESIWAGPGPATDSTDDTHCIIAYSGQMGGRPFLQNETALRYLGQYGEMPSGVVLVTVEIERETGELLLVYAAQESGRWTVERWDGCSFEGSQDWEEAAG